MKEIASMKKQAKKYLDTADEKVSKDGVCHAGSRCSKRLVGGM